MATTAVKITRVLVMCLLWLIFVGSTQVAGQVPEASGVLPVQERLPLGTNTVSIVDGQAETDAGFLPGFVEFARVGAALLGVVMLLLAMRFLLRRMSGGIPGSRPAGVLQIHARYPVARGQQIVVLQVGSRFIIAHQGGGEMRTLSEITDADEVARLKQALSGDEPSPVGDFQQTLAQAAAAASDGVVDLTRQSARSSRTPPRTSRLRLPGWRGAS